LRAAGEAIQSRLAAPGLLRRFAPRKGGFGMGSHLGDLIL
jgi:hypothetical protein